MPSFRSGNLVGSKRPSTPAKKTADGYEILQDFLDSEAAERYCDNLRRHRIEHIPEPFAKDGFVPLAQVMPELTGVLATMLDEGC